MPRAKKKSDSDEVKKKSIKTVDRRSSKTSLSKNSSKKTVVKMKPKPVIIDVIKDDEDDKIFPDLPPYLIDSLSAPEEESDPNPENIDQQKKFFSELVTEMKSDKTEVKKTEAAVTRSVGLYKNLAWKFFLGIGVLSAIVFYFYFVKLVITISPNGEEITDTMLVKISSATSSMELAASDFRESIPGLVKEINLNEEKTFLSSGEEFVGEEISGKVKLINTSAKSQSLVATTRLLSPDNKLYRLRDAVNVPANGETEAQIYVDKPTEDLAISPTTFTIPGLWVGLQDKIYGRSTEPFVYKQKISSYVKASDIEKAVSEMNSALLAKANNNEVNSEETQVIYEFLTPTKFDYTVKPGEAGESFLVKASSTILLISFSKNDIQKLINAKLKLLVPDDKDLVSDSSRDITYKLENYDSASGEVTLKVNFGGTMILKNDSDLIDKKQLVNLTKDQLDNYLKNFSEVKVYELKFRPSFIKRAPSLPERIEVVIGDLSK